ncbi:MAG: YaiI/YqxD family protein [Thermodesulfovibrio sp.]|nr:YaiI/YqxD family protein [Thermodesulfovibrio sp.]
MIKLYIDADACPVKNEVFSVARRHQLKVYLVSNSPLRIPPDELIELIIVKDGFDAADDWIAAHITETDIAVTADIPLAARCLKKGARVLDPKGRIFSEDSIGEALANREFTAFLRDMGTITGGPPPFEPKDRSRFLQRLDELIHAIMRGKR